jgi:membrane protease YdiL (CAAX protease family)
VVLLLGVVPHLFDAIASLYMDPVKRDYFIYDSLSRVVRSAGIIALIIFIISRSGESLGKFGLKPLRVLKDSALGFGIYLSARASHYFIWYSTVGALGRSAAYSLLHSNPSQFATPTGHYSISLAAAAALANGLAEEIVCRAYLITRFEQLFGSTLKALVISTLLFSSYHIYQGLGGFISVTMAGLVYGGFFCWTRRLWPVASGHAIQDFVATMMLH